MLILDQARSRCNSLFSSSFSSVGVVERVRERRKTTDRFSKLPCPTLQNPKVQMAKTVPKMMAPPGPLVGRLRRYLMGAKPCAGGRSLRWESAKREMRGERVRESEEGREKGKRRKEGGRVAHCLMGTTILTTDERV